MPTPPEPDPQLQDPESPEFDARAFLQRAIDESWWFHCPTPGCGMGHRRGPVEGPIEGGGEIGVTYRCMACGIYQSFTTAEAKPALGWAGLWLKREPPPRILGSKSLLVDPPATLGDIPAPPREPDAHDRSVAQWIVNCVFGEPLFTRSRFPGAVAKIEAMLATEYPTPTKIPQTWPKTPAACSHPRIRIAGGATADAVCDTCGVTIVADPDPEPYRSALRTQLGTATTIGRVRNLVAPLTVSAQLHVRHLSEAVLVLAYAVDRLERPTAASKTRSRSSTWCTRP